MHKTFKRLLIVAGIVLVFMASTAPVLAAVTADNISATSSLYQMVGDENDTLPPNTGGGGDPNPPIPIPPPPPQT